MRRSPPLARRGFTLVEVLIALVLLAVVSVALAQSFSYSFETKKRVSAINERYHEGRQTMVRFARELRMAFIHAEVPEQFREEDPAMLTRFKGTEDTLHFATTAHLRIHQNAKESDQSEVAYFLGTSDRDSAYEGKTLFRRESKRIDAEPERGGYIWPVVDGVRDFRIEYWDDRNGIGDDNWRRDWNSHDDQNQPLLPARVRITMELESPDGPPIRFVTQADPQLRRPINVIEEYAAFNPDARDAVLNNERTQDAADALSGAATGGGAAGVGGLQPLGGGLGGGALGGGAGGTK